MTSTELPQYTKKDFTSDQEVRWCPGCGDYSILANVQAMMPDLGARREDVVFVSGIGCSSRFPYYMDTYGFHSIHGRAPAIATGVATANQNLKVFVVTGDGDGLSIGGNHLIHALRRNVNLTIIMFNNQIYGLTKGQYSPTSEIGKITKSTPFGSLDHPFNPVSVALGAEATFVARSIDTERDHLREVIEAAAAHEGAAFIEVYQNCNIFNDGAFDALKDSPEDNQIRLVHGQQIRFGADHDKGIVMSELGEAQIVEASSVEESRLVVHDAHRRTPTLAFALSRIADQPTSPTPIGIFRDVDRPVYDRQVQEQVDADIARRGRGDLAALLAGHETWEVKA